MTSDVLLNSSSSLISFSVSFINWSRSRGVQGSVPSEEVDDGELAPGIRYDL